MARGMNSFIILSCIDDMLIAGFCIQEMNTLKKQLPSKFAKKNLGAANLILTYGLLGTE